MWYAIGFFMFACGLIGALFVPDQSITRSGKWEQKDTWILIFLFGLVAIAIGTVRALFDLAEWLWFFVVSLCQ